MNPAALWRRLRKTAERWLFRIDGPEPAPIRLVQRRIFVFPARAGFAFAAALLVMLIASINYNLSLGYGLVFLLGGAAAASILHAFRNLFGLSIRPARNEPVFCGDTAVFRLLVTNERPRRRPALRLLARGQATQFALGAETEDKVDLPCPTTHRGWLAIGRTVLDTHWPLGLIRAWSVFVPEARCLVFPAPEPDPPELPGSGEALDGGRPSLAEGDDDFAGLRAHRSADSPRHVAWKVLARGGPMLTKQYAAASGRDLVLDWDATGTGLDVEQRLSRLCAWILQAEADGRRYALVLPGLRTGCERGRAHRDRCLEQLATFGHEGGGA